MNQIPKFKTYVFYILLSWLAVASLAFIQLNFIYDSIEARYFIIPSTVGIVVGIVFAGQAILRKVTSQTQKQFEAIIEMAEEVSYLKNLDGHYQFISSAVESLTGYGSQTFYEMPNLFSDLVYEDDKALWLNYEQAILEGQNVAPLEVRLTTKNKGLVWIRHVSRALYENGVLVGISSTNTDITEQFKQSQAMEQLASNDPLTELPNRRRFTLETKKLLKANKHFSLVMMDLNRFKTINDSLGHSVGDLVLKKVCDRLMLVLPHESIMARFGGDEFVFVLPHYQTEEKVAKLMALFLKTVEEPMKIEGFNLYVSASFGWVHAPEDGEDVETLIRFADAAMYMAKQKQGTSFLRYSGHSDSHHQRLLLIENRLRKAVESKEIIPFFQPLICCKTGELIGVECLARWHDTELGWVSPAEFIPLAETTNLIGALGESILEEAVRIASGLSKDGCAENIYFSVNVSPYQLSEVGYVNKVESLLSKYRVSPTQLLIEVTESLFIGGNIQAMDVLRELRELGVRVALDDFGTGYSAFAVLREGCLDVLKVDKTFVRNIADNDQDNALIAEIIQMAHIMNLSVTAEGIEMVEQKERLIESGCDVLQGYLLGRPMAEADLYTYIDCEDEKKGLQNRL